MPKVKSLKLAVMGGLCSRLRAVLAAADWCERHDCPELVINWPKDEPNLSEFGGFTMRLSELWDIPDWWFDIDSGIKTWPKSLDSSVQKYDDVLYVRTCHPETFSPESPAALMRQLDKMTFKYECRTFSDSIGVNVRWSLRENMDVAEPEWFVDKLLQLLVCHKGNAFLVTDSADAYKRFIDNLSIYVVYWNERDFKYDANGITTQAQELYELASTKWFIGADASSYSQMVRWMRGDTEIDMRKCNNAACRSEDRLNPASAELLKEIFG